MHFELKPFEQLSLQELYDIMALRQLVFIVEQNCPYLDADGNDQLAWHLMGYSENGQLIAYTRLMPPGLSYDAYAAIGRVVTHPEKRGMGLGKQLMVESVKRVKHLFGESAVKISAQCYLQRFYGMLGFQEVGESYMEDGIPHIAMVLKEKASDPGSISG